MTRLNNYHVPKRRKPNKEPAKPKRDWYEITTLVVASVGVVFVAVYTAFTAIQVDLLAHQISYASSDASDAKVAADKAASEAEIRGNEALAKAAEANRIATQANISADRPWLGPSALPSGGYPQALKEYVVWTPIINSGHSPALNVTSNSSIDVSRPGEKGFAVLPACSVNCANTTMWPGHPLIIHTTKSLPLFTVDDINHITDGKYFVVVRLRLDYLDIYGHKHVSFACSFYKQRIGFTDCPGDNGAN